jgi:hypothetical protein
MARYQSRETSQTKAKTNASEQSGISSSAS